MGQSVLVDGDSLLAEVSALLAKVRSDIKDRERSLRAQRQAEFKRRRLGLAPPRHVRVFVSSPGDVLEERRIAREVLDALQRDPAFRGKVTIEAVAWDDPDAPVPMDARLTPQQAIDRGLPIPSDCDFTVVVLWGRMGTPLAEPVTPNERPYRSGTEYEFENASKAKRPVLLYRCTAKLVASLDVDDADLEEMRRQKKLVDAFFGQFRRSDRTLTGGYHTYENHGEFRRQFELHIKALVRQLLEQPAAVSPRAPKAPSRAEAKLEVPAAYRTWLQERCAGVDLLGLRLKQGQRVRLRHVYVPLTTARPANVEEESAGKRRAAGRFSGEALLSERDAPDALLLARVGETSAYISGDPGTGKSTFSRWLAWLACEGAVPSAHREGPEAYREQLAPSLTGRLPLLVPLRAFWRHLDEADGRTQPAWLTLEAAVARWLETEGAPGVDAELIRTHAERGSVLFIFDGIDEVPRAARVALLDALAVAGAHWVERGNRLILMSRPYDVSDGDVRRLGLPHFPVHPLPEPLQWHLVNRWFGILHERAEDASASATKMLGQVREQTWLAPLTTNPLLLTGMCIVFGDGKGLPEDKYELYDRVADAVLYNRIPDRQRQQLVRERLAVVAHGMHTGEGLGEERRTPQAEVRDQEIDRMLRGYQERRSWAEEITQSVREARDELVTETGVLLQRGEHHAAFLHLSFQEFLAAQRVADVDGGRLIDVFVDRSRVPEWRNTLSFVFANLLYTSTMPERAVRLLADLVERLRPNNVGLMLVAADAAEVLLRRGRRLAPAVDARLREGCVASMRGTAPPRERVLVGAALGRIGDPRFRADRWYLPDDDLLGFIEIPAGLFKMGSDKMKDPDANDDETPQHEVMLPTYYIAKWPVTVAQFKAFVEDPANGGFVPADSNCLKGVSNHPVVNVSWHEALAYCRWLTEQLRTSAETPEPLQGLLRGEHGQRWRVTLASEAEWEKAARGDDGRIYPWGTGIQPDRANFEETDIGEPSAVGCFPNGKSPYDVEELSGNVWEWTRSIWSERYRYRPDYEGGGGSNSMPVTKSAG